jgi:uncharacterized membrane protein
MTTFLKLYAVALPTFLAVDLLWLGVVARSFYRDQLGHLMRPDVNWTAALAFYALFVAGIVVLAVWPAVEKESLARALGLGALLGLVSYAAYDLTNLATLRDFPLTMALVDLVWGTFLCATVSGVTYAVWARLG